MHRGLHLKYMLRLSDFKQIWIFLADFLKILRYQISWKSVLWKLVCSMRTHRRKNRQIWRSLRVAFRNFANAPKKRLSVCFPLVYTPVYCSSGAYVRRVINYAHSWGRSKAMPSPPWFCKETTLGLIPLQRFHINRGKSIRFTKT